MDLFREASMDDGGEPQPPSRRAACAARSLRPYSEPSGGRSIGHRAHMDYALCIMVGDAERWLIWVPRGKRCEINNRGVSSHHRNPTLIPYCLHDCLTTADAIKTLSLSTANLEPRPERSQDSPPRKGEAKTKKVARFLLRGQMET